MTDNMKAATNSRVFLLMAMGMMSAFGPFVTDFYLPGLPALAASFGTTTSWVQMSLTSSMIGLAGGQLLIGPASDRYGRRMPLMLSMALFILSTLACLFAWNIESFVFFRIFQGIAGAGGVVISKSVAADLYQGKALNDFFSLLMVINGLAPIVAPVLGGFIMRYTDWEGIFIILLAVGVILFAVSVRFRESLPPEQRIPGSVWRSFGKFVPIIRNGSFMHYVWIQTFSMGVFFTYIASSPFLIQEHFRLDAFAYSLCFAINASGMIVGSRITPRFSDVFSALKTGVYGLCIASGLFVAVLFAGGLFYVMEALLFIMMVFLGMILPTSTSLALTLERKNAGGASAVIGFFLFIFGAIVSPMTGFGPMILSISVMTLLCCLLAFVFLRIAARRARQNREEKA
ncbi:multidrug effflux MFS transporter [Oxalobacter sp. OxGP1]|uniref:multidrug effflux MFS transporter n=1 Tax=Oxalobacter paeniformigenes TaxID=2946594 RepID=UPI0022AF590F|nr:multidrug effflux MFS transporter [Oxalobacter paeniformigenes]MCZ4052724.1 multidrug effflux MFS transporter [Oxalobacter paeniformigenes]